MPSPSRLERAGVDTTRVTCNCRLRPGVLRPFLGTAPAGDAAALLGIYRAHLGQAEVAANPKVKEAYLGE